MQGVTFVARQIQKHYASNALDSRDDGMDCVKYGCQKGIANAPFLLPMLERAESCPWVDAAIPFPTRLQRSSTDPRFFRIAAIQSLQCLEVVPRRVVPNPCSSIRSITTDSIGGSSSFVVCQLDLFPVAMRTVCFLFCLRMGWGLGFSSSSGGSGCSRVCRDEELCQVCEAYRRDGLR